MPQDSAGDGLRATCVPQLIFHAVAEAMHGDLLVADLSPQPLHHHGRGRIAATGAGILWEDGVGIREPTLMPPKAFCSSLGQRDASCRGLGLEATAIIGLDMQNGPLKVYILSL